MRRAGVVLLLCVAAQLPLACGGDEPAPRRAAAVIAERRVAPRILDLTSRSPALGRTAKVRLMTPAGWNRTRRWPVLYLLHGCCDSYVSWTRSTRIESWPQLREVLVVMPEGGDVGFYADWREGDPPPGWETFHLDEVRHLLERGYGAGRRRAIAGLSMGGLGAMGYAARRPGMFRAAASFSGLLHPLRDSRFLLDLFGAYTPDPKAIWGDPEADHATWAEHDPTELAARLRGVRLFVSAGNGRPGPLDPATAGADDAIEPRVLAESRAFARRLARLGIPVRTHFYGRGTHSWMYFERELARALPDLLDGAAAAR